MPLSGAPPLLSPALAGAVGVVAVVVELVVGWVTVVVLPAPAPIELGLVRVVVEPDSPPEPQAPRASAAATVATVAGSAIRFIGP
jgi:hypothetical protein